MRREARRGKEKAVVALSQSDAAPPADASAPPSLLGVVSESFGDALADYIDKNPDGALKDKVGCLIQNCSFVGFSRARIVSLTHSSFFI